MKRIVIYWSILLVLAFLVSACGGNSVSQTAPTVVPVSTATPLPTFTPTQAPKATPVFTATPIPNPLQISAMRARQYPGSDITIEKTLDPGVNYSRFYVSYR